jgi:S1-C subfamily serine protease
MRSRVLIAIVLVLLTRVASADSGDVRGRMHAASVTIGGGCSGALVDGPDLVVTALHCVVGRDTLDVRFTNGVVRTGFVAATDDVADQAVLLLAEPVAIAPLAVARTIPIPGSIVYFEGNPNDPRYQEAQLERVGRCPSLPGLPDALFTTVHGVPGDSGAPLVDAAARIVGLVHGGAQCEIATPADTLARLIDRVLAP